MAESIFLVFGPSGCGKTSIVAEVLGREQNLVKPTTYTTRPMRTGEKHGQDYYFLTEDEFDKERASFTETSQYHGYWYGSKADDIWKHVYAGKDVIMILDFNGIQAYCDWAYETEIVRPFVVAVRAEDAIGQILDRAKASGETVEQVDNRIALMESEAALAADESVDIVIDNASGDMTSAVETLIEFINLHR